MEYLEISYEHAYLIYFAYKNNILYMLSDIGISGLSKEKIKNLEEGEISDRELYDKLVEELSDEGITNRKLYQHNGYPTIVYSKGLGKLLKTKVEAYGFDTIKQVIIDAYRHGYKNGIKLPTLNTFFKDENGMGINNYIEQYFHE